MTSGGPRRTGALSAHKLERLRALMGEEGAAPAGGAIPRRSAAGMPPLSVGEEQLWFLARLAPEDPAYAMPFEFRLDGPLAAGALAAALAALVARHEALRTVYPAEAGRPVKAALAEPPRLPVVDLRGLPAAAREAEASRLARAEGARPFDLERGPLLRAALLALEGEAHRLLLTVHHIAADGASMAVLLRELPALYRDPASLPPPGLQYGDFAAWQREWLAGEEAASRRLYWRERLRGLTPLALPADRPETAALTSRGGAVPVALDAARAEALRRLGREERATPFMVLLAVFQSLLGRWAGQEDLAVGSPLSGRERPELADVFGFFVNMVVLRADLAGEPPFRAAVGRARDGALAAFAHGDLPFETLVEELRPERRQSRNPLFQAALVLQDPAPAAVREGGLSWEMAEVLTGRAKFDLELELREGPAGLSGRLWYARDLFDAPTVLRLAGHLGELLAGAAEGPDRPLSELPLLAAAERHQLTLEWAGGRRPYPAESGLHQLFAAQAARTPEATALVFGGERVSYAELDRLAGRVARRLISLGVGPESRVGIFAERSIEMVAATLGVLMAGACYLPFDVQSPAERLEWMLADAEPAAVLVQERLAARLPASSPLVVLEEAAAWEGEAPAGAWAGADSAAYMMYTSGSTGRPKAVVVTHRNVVRLVRETDFADLGPEEVFLQLTAVSFDVATFEIWGALLNGGRLVICAPGLPSLAEIGRTIEREGVTTLWLTSGLFHQMVDQQLASLAGVRQLVAGGDVLSPAHVARAFAALPGCRLIDGYGPTENTTFTTCHTVTEAPSGPVPIGVPIANTWVRVVDRALRPLPVGAPGELLTGGEGLARGYFRRPDLTAERFVPDPFSAEPGARLYRTGDLARWRPDGTIDFLGRIDGQVKIRGFRIETGEVERALEHHPGVASCAVVAREDRAGGRFLLACWVAAEGGLPPASGDLRAFLERSLPPPMIPAAFARLEALPLTVNGKVDRRALPAFGEESGAAAAYRAPRTPAEELLAAIWAEVLGEERVGVEADFFALGGHSLKMMQVAARVREAFGTELPLRELFELPTVAGLAARLERGGGERAIPPLRRFPRAGRLPLSYAQSRLWFLDQLEPGQAAYNVPMAADLEGALSVPALAAALQAVAARHESLRTAFPLADLAPVQAVGGPPPAALPVVDLGGLPAAVVDAEAARLEADAARRPFDLTRGPLLRALLLRRGTAEHTLVVACHHIVADGWSLGVLWRELEAGYAAFRRGEGSGLPELPVQYPDYTLWQREWLRGEALERLLAYWRPRLEGAAVLEIAADHPRPAVRAGRGAERSRSLSPELVESLRALSRRRGATLFMTLLASLQALLHRYTGQADLAVGSPMANRGAAGLEGLIGFFANTLVLRGAVDGGMTFGELLGACRGTALDAYAHQDVPFELLVQELQPERDLRHAPLFQVMLTLERAGAPPRLDGLATRVRILSTGTAKFDLGFSFLEGDEPAAGIECATDLFEEATAERMLGHWLTLLQGALADPEARVEGLPLLAAEERQHLLEQNATARAYDLEECLHESFAAQAARTPDAVAVTCEGEALTYRQLDARAEGVARRLRELGVGTDTLVGICAERSLEMMAGLLGILKAGGAYVPIDPSHPAERLAYVLADSAVPVVLVQRRLVAKLPAGHGARVLLLEEAWEPAMASAERRGLPGSLAYMIYTSGSTGRPKGVLNSHRAIRNRLLWGQEAFALTAADRVLQKTPFSFDVSVWELFWPLTVGARLVMARPGGHQDPDYLAALIAREGITLAHFVPSMLRAFLEARGLERRGSLRRVICSGEALPADLARAFFARLDAELHNLYGPTEAAVEVTAWRCEPGSRSPLVPIGRPIANTAIHLLDRRGRRVPVGVPGELCIGGVQPARGYWRRPELTAEKLIPDAYGGSAGEPGARLYRTGDLCRRRPDGAIEFLGRIDHQVKIRGVRIELEEIEAALREHPGVRQAAVAVRGQGSDALLAAWVVPAELPPAIPAIRRFLQERLPEAMVPAAFVVIPELPLTSSGKVDRKALPDPAAPERPAGAEGERTPLEEILAALWAEVLGAPTIGTIGARDDFFALGGHSLKATQVVSRIRAGLGVDLPLRTLFEAPTLAGLAARVEPLLGVAAAAAPPPPEPADRRGPLPLSFAQQRLWFLDRLRPGNPAYNVPALLGWEGELAPAVLERALAAIVARHETLRTTFDLRDGEPVQVIAPAAPLRLPVVDLEGLPAGRRATVAKEAEETATALGRAPFDLARGPLARFVLFRLEGHDHRLLAAFHHIAADWWSLGVFLRELGDLYAAFERGEGDPLAPLPLQYADFAAWQREALRGERLERQLAYWRERLAGVPVLELPADRPRPARRTFRGASHPFVLPADLSERLGAVARAEGATRFMVLLAAFQALLGRLSGQDDFAVGTPIAGRNQEWIEGLIGFFVNTLVLRVGLAGAPSFRQAVRRVRDAALGAYAHQDVPFERLVDELAPQRDLGHPPLFQALLTFQNELPARDLPGRSLRLQGLPLEAAKLDLTLALGDGPEGLEGYLEHDLDLFDAATARVLSERFARLLAAALADPGTAVEELPLLSAAERAQVLDEWNDTGWAGPSAPVHARFAAWAARRPEAPALVCDETRWSYGELAGRVGRLAGHLRELGVGPEVVVGICLERSAEAVLALLAVLAAGGAYVPLDPTHPRERLAALLADAGAAVAVTREGLLERLPAVAAVCLDRDAAALVARSPFPEAPPAGGADLDHLAYVLFTSGSTGRPKGVAVGHRQLAGYVDGVLDRLGLSPGASYATVSTLAADLGNTAVFPALCTGGCLHVISERRATDPVLFAEYLRRERVDCLKIVPSHLAALMSGPDPAGALPRRRLVLGGEASSWEMIAGLRALAPGLGILNHYGPTETTVGVLTGPVGEQMERVERAATVPLGRPLPGARVYVLDRGLAPLPAGVPGELCIGGGSLARGYLGRAGLTAERFVPDPYAGLPGARLYRTGDRARRLPDGAVEFLGRVDHQVKIRGFRVEPGEIEAALVQAGALQAVVMVRSDRSDGSDRSVRSQLVAYVTGGVTAAELRQALRAQLPDFMVPALFVELAALPLTPNGKVDRQALPLPAARAPRAAASPSGLTRRIAEVWREVLAVEEVGPHENFFDLGGHSLLLIRVQGRLRAALGREIPVVDLFRFPTVSALAAHLGGAAEETETAPAAPAAALDGGRCDVAVIGLAGRFPGADNPRELWEGLCAGRESITFFGAPEAGSAPGQRSVPARGIVAGADRFDAGFFGVRPREAELLDPQHRLFLECAWEALESAGYDPGAYPGAIGVWAGVGRSWYYLSQIHGGAAAEEPEAHFGNDKDFLPTRVSYKLGLRGPSLAVQTSCSSSLVAVHLACRGLAAGECDMALAGGVRLVLPQEQGYVYEEGGIASPDGHCRAFDAAAGGVVPGNGVGVVLLKRLEAALADGDPVLAVIKGSAINNDGAGKVGYTAPSVAGQARVIAAAHAAAGVSAADISYVEAHGTGTALGDPIEVAALKEAFAAAGERRGVCALGSIKTNIGHLDAAAGVAGLIKAVLALRHRSIPPTLHFRRANPELDLDESPFFVNAAPLAWESAGPRRAGVSSFGIGGTNAHVVLEEAPAAEPSGSASRPWHLLTVSARSAAALERAAGELADHLEAGAEGSLADVAWTLHAGRRAFSHRRAVVVGDDPAAAAQALRSAAGDREAAMEVPVAFLFPGQGAQRAGMARELYELEPAFRAGIDRAAGLLLPRLGLDLRRLLIPPAGTEDEAARLLARTELTQPALFAVEHALAGLWISWGIRPEAMLGHSVGEYVAACLAGVFSFADGLALVAERGRLMGEVPAGAMLAVPLHEAETRARLSDGLALAAVNGVTACVVAGETAAVEALQARLLAEGIEGRRLRVSHAFHSPMMDPVLDRFAAAVSRVELRPPTLPWVSNVSGTWILPEEAVDPAYWARHLRATVRFQDGAGTLLAGAGRILLEVGPGETLSRFARRHPTAHGRPIFASLPGEGSGQRALLEALGGLWAAGARPDWQGFHAGERRRRVPLPTYPFERQRYWLERRETAPALDDASVPAEAVRDLLRAVASAADPAAAARRLLDGMGAAGAPAALAGEPALLPEEPEEAGPADEVEGAIARIWRELFGLARIGVHDSFFALGGDSLLATQIVARVRAALGREVTLSGFLEAGTIARLAEICRALPTAVPAAALLADLESLSADELEELLAAGAAGRDERGVQG